MKAKHILNQGLDTVFFKTIFAVVLIVDIILSVLLWGLFSGTQIPYSRQQSVMQIEQVCTSIDILYSSLEALTHQILTNPDTYASLSTQTIDRLQEHQTAIQLRALKSANPYIRYVGLYNSSTDRYLSNAYVGAGNDIHIQKIYERLKDNKYICLMRDVGNSYPSAPERTIPVYTFVFSLDSLPENSLSRLIILDVYASYFNDVLKNINLKDVLQEVEFLDGNQQMITRAFSQKGSLQFTYSPALTNFSIDSLPVHSGLSGFSSHFSSSGAYQFTAYATAPKSNWMVVHSVPYTSLLSPLIGIGLLTLILFVFTLGIGYLLSKRASHTLYAPIQQLYFNYVNTDIPKKGNELDLLRDSFQSIYEKADKLEQGLISSYQQSKNLYLLRLLQGDILAINKSFSVYERLQINLHSPYYGMLIIECSPEQHPQDLTPDTELFIAYYGLENMTQELIHQYVPSEFLRLKENLFAALLYLPSLEISPKLNENLQMIPQIMKREFHIETSICIGTTTDAWQNINMIYEQTLLAMNNRTLDRQGQVFFSIEKSDRMRADYYYNRLDLKFAEYVRSSDNKACEKEFDTAIVKMENISFKTARSYFKHILMSVLDNFSFTFGKDDENFYILMNMAESLEQQHNVQEIRSVCLQFFTFLITQLNYSKQNSNRLTAEKVKSYIDTHYDDPNLSLKMLSELFHLSPPYLGKIFSAVISYSFTDYLSQVRISKAAELLKTSRKSVSAISETVGILNSNYFYSLFKKHYHVTPSEYRKQNKAN